MDLNEVLIFTRVVQAGSFTAGGRVLGLPKSTVSRKVADLEDRLGARLLQRTTRKLSLTDVGRAYYEHGSRIVAEAEEADRAVGRMHAAPCGSLRVTTPLTFSLLGPAVAAYLERYPEVQLEVVCTDRRVDLVEEGFDVAIRAGQLGDSTLIARRLGSIPRWLVAAPVYLEKHGEPRSPADLERHTCLAFGPTAAFAWKLQRKGRSTQTEARARMAVNDFEMLLAVTRAGIGIAGLPAYVCEQDLNAGRLRRVLPQWDLPETELHALYPSTRHLSAKVTAFLQFVQELLPTSLRAPEPAS